MIRIAYAAVAGAVLGLLVVSVMRGALLPVLVAFVMFVVGTLLALVAYAAGLFDGLRQPAGAGPAHGSRNPQVPQPSQPPWLDGYPTHNPGAPGIPTTELNRPPQPPNRRPEPPPAPVAAPPHPGGQLAPLPQVEERAPQSAAVHIWNGWSGGQPARAPGEPPPRHFEQAAPPPPDVNAYGRERRVVQCPLCVSLRINVQQHPDGLAFQCVACKHSWKWTPGGRWPPVTSGLPARSAPPTDAF